MKGVSVYGAFEVRVPVFQRYWKRRSDGVKQRYWIRTSRTRKVVKTDGRYEFTGKGKDLYRAVIEARRRIPRGYFEVEAEEFLAHPERYSQEGRWVEWRVVS